MQTTRTIHMDGAAWEVANACPLRYVPEQLPNGQWLRDTRDDELRIQAVRFRSEAVRRAAQLNRDFLDAEW